MTTPTEKRAFTITYFRHDEGDQWEATIEPREGLEQADFIGFVAYTTALWEGEAHSKTKSAHVTVLVEFDANPARKAMSLHAAIDDAVRLAETHFKARHPSAQVKYHDFDIMPLL